MYGINLLAAAVLLVAGWLAASWLGKLVRGRAEKSGKLDPTLAIILGKVTRGVVLLLTLVAVLNQFHLFQEGAKAA